MCVWIIHFILWHFIHFRYFFSARLFRTVPHIFPLYKRIIIKTHFLSHWKVEHTQKKPYQTYNITALVGSRSIIFAGHLWSSRARNHCDANSWVGYYRFENVSNFIRNCIWHWCNSTDWIVFEALFVRMRHTAKVSWTNVCTGQILSDASATEWIYNFKHDFEFFSLSHALYSKSIEIATGTSLFFSLWCATSIAMSAMIFRLFSSIFNTHFVEQRKKNWAWNMRSFCCRRNCQSLSIQVN